MKKTVCLAAMLAFFPVNAIGQEQCSSVADCAQKAMEAAFQTKVALQLAVPKGAVMAFNLSSCPKGWTPIPALNGRVVVGAGQGSGLTNRVLSQNGGAELHTLTIPQMPAHAHVYSSTNNGQLLDNGGNFPAQPRYGVIRDKTTTAAGGNQPHNIMQPFHVLLYCERK